MPASRPSVRALSLAAVLATIPAVGFSHALGHSHGHSADGSFPVAFAAGFLHPMTGIDHLLAIVAVALWVSSAGWWHRFALLGTFSWLMVVGALIGMVRPGLPALEMLVAGSVVAGGVVLISGRKFHMAHGLTLGAVFALIHGYAHGQEIGAALALPYFLGFVSGFLLLALGAIVAGHQVRRRNLQHWIRPAGMALVCAGGIFLTGAL